MGANLKANGDVHHLDHFVIAVMDPDSGGKILQRGLGSVHLEDSKRAQHDAHLHEAGRKSRGTFFSGKSDAAQARQRQLLPASFLSSAGKRIRRDGRQDSPRMLVRARHRARTRLGLFLEARAWFFRTPRATSSRSPKRAASVKTRLHHLHFDTTDLDASVNFYRKFLNCTVEEQGNGYAAVTVPSGQCVVLNRVSELSEVTKSTYRGRHFAFNVTDDNFHAIVDKLHAAGIEERDDHGEREGRRPEQLGTYFREPSGFRLQITNENSAEFARHAND